jgi:hypothetical protein
MTAIDLELCKAFVEGRLAPTGLPDTAALADKTLVRGHKEEPNLTVEDTPALWTLPAILVWLPARDLYAVIEVCEPLPDTGAIKKGACLLRRDRLLKKLARNAPPNNAGEESDRAIHATTSQTQALLQGIAASTNLRLARVWPSRRKSYERLQRQRPEDEKIFERIETDCRGLINNLVAGKLTAQGDHKETGWCERIPPGQFCGVRSLLRILESRVGPYRNVVVARAEVLQLWPERAKEPVTEHPTAEAQARPELPHVAIARAEALQRGPSPLATVPNEPVRSEAGDRMETCASSDPRLPAGTAIDPVEPIANSEKLEEVLPPKKVTEKKLRNWFETNQMCGSLNARRGQRPS